MPITLKSIGRFLFLFSIVEYLFPSVQHKYKKAAIGALLRIIGFFCTQIISVHMWEYHCNSSFGCEQYNTIRSYMTPYKSIIKYFAQFYLDIINSMMQASDIDIIKQQMNDMKAELNDIRTAVSADHIHAITIPDDYIHEQPPSQRVVRPRIDIHEEFRRANHLHAE